MGMKTGLFFAAVGIAMTLHSYHKKKKTQQNAIQAPPAQQQQQSSSSWGKWAAGAAGIGGAGYLANQYFNKPSGSPHAGYQQQQALPAAPPSYEYRATLRDPAAIYHHLCECCAQKQLQAFYPPHQAHILRQIAERIASSGSLEQLANDWDLPDPLALDLVRLALFDIILLVDDSASMRQGGNVREMQGICSEIAHAASLFDDSGIDLRFFNSNDSKSNIRSAHDVEAILSRNPPSGRTPMGESLRDKILKPMTIKPANQRCLQKPQLIIIFTDGASTDSSRDAPPRVITQAREALRNTVYGENCVFFSFSQVGDDPHAIKYLSDLDEDRDIGGSIDVTSSTRFEAKQIMDSLKEDMGSIPPQWQPLVQEEMRPDSPLWQALFRVKRLVGAIHPWYDQSDETSSKLSRFSLSGRSNRSRSMKPHWSEDPDYISSSTQALKSRGYDPFPTGQAQPPPPAQWGSPAPPQADPYSSAPTPGRGTFYQAYTPPTGSPAPGSSFNGGYQNSSQSGYQASYNQPPDPYANSGYYNSPGPAAYNQPTGYQGGQAAGYYSGGYQSMPGPPPGPPPGRYY